MLSIVWFAYYGVDWFLDGLKSNVKSFAKVLKPNEKDTTESGLEGEGVSFLQKENLVEGKGEISCFVWL